MYCGSVPPRYRGNGYYRALVTARLADAVARGARHAFSFNTPMSRPLFEAVGFRRVETWTYLAPAIE
jgi:N-acetylglutamate synthase-like GNAT family acetyltransferase